jgi:hypothetical protein
MSDTEEYLTVEELARRLNWAPKTVRNKMGPKGIFRKGIHYSEAPGLPVLFRWSAVVAHYRWESDSTSATDAGVVIPMARGYSMK